MSASDPVERDHVTTDTPLTAGLPADLHNALFYTNNGQDVFRWSSRKITWQEDPYLARMVRPLLRAVRQISNQNANPHNTGDRPPAAKLQDQADKPWSGPDTSLRCRYEDSEPGRLITFGSSFNHEMTIQIGDGEPVFVDGLDLMRVVSHVVLNLVYEPSPTESGRWAE